MTKETFDAVYPVIQRLVALASFRGLANGHFYFDTKWEHRKNEYVFGVSMRFELYNLKVEDYTCVMFNDSDSNESYAGDFEEMRENIDSFLEKVKMLSGTEVPTFNP